MAFPIRTWSDLPIDLLQIVCKKLHVLNDFAVFGAVCSHWQTALLLCHKHIPPQVPLLMLPDTSGRHTAFFSPDFCIHRIHLKRFTCCYGSSHGWLITRALRKVDTLELLNPFLSINNVIQLSCPLGEEGIFKAVLSKDPSETSNYAVIIINFKFELAFFKSGNTSWTHIDQGHHLGFDDITYYNDQLYAITCEGKLVSCNIYSTAPSLIRVASSHSCTSTLSRYLVVSAGELLCFELNTDFESESVEFQVLKVETRSGKVVELKNLRGHSIYLSQYSCISVFASDYPNCKPDHIYFSMYRLMGMHDMAVINLIDESIQCSQVQYFIRRSVWILPRLNISRIFTEGSSRNLGWRTRTVWDAAQNKDNLDCKLAPSLVDGSKQGHRWAALPRRFWKWEQEYLKKF